MSGPLGSFRMLALEGKSAIDDQINKKTSNRWIGPTSSFHRPI